MFFRVRFYSYEDAYHWTKILNTANDYAFWELHVVQQGNNVWDVFFKVDRPHVFHVNIPQ